ncbi:MAG TPA: beta-ketoacyl synthase N-terminal-like domain-containing protein, partial [Candidatus Polarisedimenticolaceae bacterium]|nr:beta-ketoacyl synthase N-terminal-like domain-containing protein [Candidatus Polarisedimenticolaceae bacterium]
MNLAVTGCGTINALGRDVPSFWNRLVRGECGLRLAARGFVRAWGIPAGEVDDPLPGDDLSPFRTDRLALVAAEEAVRQSEILTRHRPERIAVVLGTTTGGIREAEEYFAPRAARGRRGTLLRGYEKAHTAEVLARRFGLAGPRYTLHSACASGASAILLGGELLRSGRADAVLAGGSDALARITLSGFRSLRLLDAEPCRPFDRARRGLSLGEGAGMLVLERSAPAVLAELLSAAQTTDAHHLTAPAESGDGAARAMRLALERGGLA